ncbi:MAG: sulfatase-like hydrolase/transferase [Verrucomicrobiaceae bacterium]|nr:sulfatase-like hydrolase/transferase [Verrucomicrobiaceae bacterium]
MHANNVEHSKIPTPNLDQLAAEGMQFTDWHSSSGCCSPSRCTLLKGADKPVRTHSINTACGGSERLNRRFSLQNQRVPRHS